MEAHIYEDMAKMENHLWWFVGRRNIINSTLKNYISNDKDLKILEVGCGTGGNFSVLKNYGDVTGLEPSPHAAKFLEKHDDVVIKTGGLPAEGLFEKESFDVIVAFDVVEHLKHEKECLSSLLQYLKPGGKFIVTVPAFKFLWSSHDISHHHFRRYSKPELKSLLKDNGLKITMLSYFNSLLFPVGLSLRLMDKYSKGMAKVGSEDAPPSPLLNSILTKIFSFEGILLKILRFPFGMSLIAVTKKD